MVTVRPLVAALNTGDGHGIGVPNWPIHLFVSRHHYPNPVRGAFSFMEVPIVVAIAATLVTPMFGNDDPTKLIAAARQRAGDLAFAQVESISHGDDLRVVGFDTVAHAYSITPASDTGTPLTNPVGGDDILGFGPYSEFDQTTGATIQD